MTAMNILLPSPRFLLCTWLVSASTAAADPSQDIIAKGDAADRKLQTKEALAAYLEADKAQPNQAAILVKIAKEYGGLMNDAKTSAERKEAAAQSLAYSRKALAADAKSSDANLAVAISLGKSVEFMGNREKVETSSQIKAYAEKALQLNPKSDYAHHMLGRWHQGLAGVGGATRVLAQVVYGGLPAATYQEALDHFQKARALRPDRLVHQIEYGRTLAMMGRKDEARTEIQKGLAMPNREKDDPETKARGKETLDHL